MEARERGAVERRRWRWSWTFWWRCLPWPISPLGIVSANRAGIPVLLLENFTWDWIYEPFSRKYPRFTEISAAMKRIFESASIHGQYLPACVPSENWICIMKIKKIPKIFYTIFSIFCILILWQIASNFLSSMILPSVKMTIQKLIEIFKDEKLTGMIASTAVIVVLNVFRGLR